MKIDKASLTIAILILFLPAFTLAEDTTVTPPQQPLNQIIVGINNLQNQVSNLNQGIVLFKQDIKYDLNQMITKTDFTETATKLKEQINRKPDAFIIVLICVSTNLIFLGIILFLKGRGMWVASNVKKED